MEEQKLAQRLIYTFIPLLQSKYLSIFLDVYLISTTVCVELVFKKNNKVLNALVIAVALPSIANETKYSRVDYGNFL